jgi:Ca-activated chloride channel family protein
MLVDTEDPSQGYMTDPSTYDDAVSHIDVANLEKVAGQLDVAFVHRTSQDPAAIAQVAASFRSAQVDSSHTARAKEEKTWVFGFVLLPLLLWELWAHRRKAREVRGMLR